MADPTSKPLFFQDVVKKEGLNENELSLAFFELANVERVGYRLGAEGRKRKRPREIVVQQDTSACNQHTGGIVWETSYLLLNYLLHRQEKLGKTLEVGAGCGLLGQVLGVSGWTKRPVVLTEAPEAMKNLECNVAMNARQSKKEHAIARQLDWMHPERDAEHFPRRSFDTIIGTDVVFSPPLVEPLLSTLKLLSHERTVVYLCLQVRCADSHQLFLDKAVEHGFVLENTTSRLESIPSCAWGLQMECQLLRLTRVTSNDRATKKRTKQQDDTASKRDKKSS